MARPAQMDDRRVLERVDPDLVEHAARIGYEFLEGFKAVDRIGRPGATIFGSARIRDDHPMYQRARETGRLFANEGFAVVTGGGPGVMEAANRGAKEAGGVSVGFRIELPREELANPYLDISVLFDHFYARKTMLVKAAEGFVLFPGGFGTLDELFESLVLIQTGEVEHFPAVLFGQSYWEGLLAWIRRNPLRERMISPEDLDLLFVTDDPAEAVEVVVDCYRRKCAETPAQVGKADAQ
jgi:uncharacterized protein (TIGR00730 family)